MLSSAELVEARIEVTFSPLIPLPECPLGVSKDMKSRNTQYAIRFYATTSPSTTGMST